MPFAFFVFVFVFVVFLLTSPLSREALITISER